MSDSLVDDLQVQLSELQRLVADQAREIAGLRADVRRLEDDNAGLVQARSPAEASEGTKASGAAPTLSRRAFARLGAMAGVGAAAGAAAVLGSNASPAVAAEGAGVLLGKDNGGATARTGIFATGGSLYATLADPEVAIGDSPLGAKTVAAGVAAKGTIGVLGAGIGQNGAGVYATDNAINASATAGSELCTGVEVWLQGAANENSAIYAQSDGLGDGLTVLLTSPSNQNCAINAINGGSGPAIWATDQNGLKGFLVAEDTVRRVGGTGPGLLAQLRNPNNGSPAVAAHTLGWGNGLEVSATSGAAVSATSTTGPAMELSSHVAHLRFTPGPADHPAEGETGDLFVDAAGHLWFCRDPGAWVKLA